MNRPNLILIIVTLLNFVLPPSMAQKPFVTAETSRTTQQDMQAGWLGVMVTPLPPELKAQLAPMMTADQGIMVEWVENNSPAQQSGIQRFDVLVSFAGQKLYSAKQLSNLVHYSAPGSQVEIDIIQQGQLKTVQVILSSRQPKTIARTHRPPRYQPPAFTLPPHQPDPSIAWDSFESVEVSTLPDGRYRATVSYKDQSNETKTFTFEGKKQEILQQIQQQKELPLDKKQALLRALNLEPKSIPKFFPYGYFDDLLHSPPYRHDPFDHPFFRDPFYYDPWRTPYSLPPWQLHIYPDQPSWNERNRRP